MTQTPAFDAAVDAVSPGVEHAQIRAHVAELVVAAVADRCWQHGQGHMLLLATGPVNIRRDVCSAISATLTPTRVGPALLDNAVRAAARAMFDHPGLNEGAV